MAFTRPIARPDTLPSDRTISFGEATRGGPPPIAAWYPIDSTLGHAFIY
jgi:hypothetical protein